MREAESARKIGLVRGSLPSGPERAPHEAGRGITVSGSKWYNQLMCFRSISGRSFIALQFAEEEIHGETERVDLIA